MASPWIAALGALFAWWFSTGAILLAVRRSEAAGGAAPGRLALAALPLLPLGLWGLHATMDRTDPAGAYLAFASALAVWGWIELAFLTGAVTGPNDRPCPPRVPEWERFIRGWGTLAYHEMLLTAALLAVLIAGWGAENPAGVWTYAVLYGARVSAKLNLYLGVPHMTLEFTPRALSHMPSHFRTGRMSALFPVSITLLTLAAACWIERGMAAGTPGEAVAFALLAAITALALIEHWFLVLPVPDAELWRWMLPDRPAPRAPNAVEDA